MIVIDKKTEYSLLIVTNPNCSVCRELQKNDMCEKIPLTRKLLLAPFSPMDELAIQAIFKSKNPLNAYKQLLSDNPLNPSDIIWDKDISDIWRQNISMFDYLSSHYDMKGTPSFFIIDKNDKVIESIKLEMTPVEVLNYNINKFLHLNK